MKRIFLVFVVLFTFSSSGIIAHLYNRTDDLSLRYILWKNGLYSYPTDIIGQSVIADKNRNNLINGKTKEEIKQIFPNAHEESINDYQRSYEKELIGREYLWLGDNGVIIFLRNGKGKEISIMKG
jgi:hypothetical protein